MGVWKTKIQYAQILSCIAENYLEKLSGKTIWKKYMEKLSGKCEKFMRKIYAVSIIVSLVILRGKW